VSHYYKIKYEPGIGSNMKAELSALWALLSMVDTLNLRKLQILGDSKTTIDWVKGLVQIQVPIFVGSNLFLIFSPRMVL